MITTRPRAMWGPRILSSRSGGPNRGTISGGFPAFKQGLNLKVLKKTLDSDSALGYMADFGFQYTAQGEWSQGLRTGVVLQNVGTGLAFNGEKTPFPMMLKLGSAYSLFGDNMTLAGDAVLPRDGNPTYLTLGPNIGFGKFWLSFGV
jgi:hypothetical protein